MDLKVALKHAIEQVITQWNLTLEIGIQETPADKPGDYGTPVAFLLAKALKQNPAALAAKLASEIQLPAGIARAEAVGPYLNFFVDAPAFIRNIVEGPLTVASKPQKVIIEHTSVNPNKELHVGHLRNVVLGDAMARIYRAAGYQVEVQNYIDDTGRQAADSLFAASHYGETYQGEQKYDHWLGALYVRLHQDLADAAFKEQAEPEIRAVMHRLEAGELREAVETVVKSQLESCYALGATYDLLTWESDIVGSGFLDKAMNILENSKYCFRLTEGKYTGCLVMDTTEFLPGLEDPMLVLLRSDGTATYTAKDIAFQFWKFGLFTGLQYREFAPQPNGTTLYTSHPQGETSIAGHSFAHAHRVINVIDARQSHPQAIVKASLAIAGHPEAAANSHHLAYATVLLEGQTISGRKGITVSVDEVITEAHKRAAVVLADKALNNPQLVAAQVGLGALRFAMLKSEPNRQIDFRWDAALALQGDTAPYIQYAAVRAGTILRKAQEAGVDVADADYSVLSPLELTLAKEIARYQDVIATAVRDNSPHHVVSYALDLANTFNGYYNHKDASGKPDTRVMDAPTGLREARLAIVGRMQKALQQALAVLGIEVPSEM